MRNKIRAGSEEGRLHFIGRLEDFLVRLGIDRIIRVMDTAKLKLTDNRICRPRHVLFKSGTRKIPQEISQHNRMI